MKIDAGLRRLAIKDRLAGHPVAKRQFVGDKDLQPGVSDLNCYPTPFDAVR
jgi:hypothetical protein